VSTVVPDTPAAVDWLRHYDPTGPWLLVAIEPTESADQRPQVHLAAFSPGEEIAMTEWIEGYQNRYNLYFTVNQPRLPFRTAKKEAMELCRALHLDDDLPGDAADPAAAAAQLAILRSLVPPPTAIIFSGGGHQAFWRLAEKLPAAEYAERVERVNQAILREVRAGAGTHDVSRLMRLPGTVNVLSFKKRQRGRVPALAHVVEADWSRTWSFARDAVPKLPPEIYPIADDASSAGKTGRHGSESGILDSLPQKVRRLVKSGDASDFGNDRSKLGWHIMCSLVRLGWTDEDVSKIFLDQSCGCSAHYVEQPNPSAYVARNIARARENVAKDWKRNAKTGAVIADDQDNLDHASSLLGLKLSYDTFADRLWMNGAGPLRQITDPEMENLWFRIDRDLGFRPTLSFLKVYLSVRAREASFHPVLDYFARLPAHDGVPRLGHPDREEPGWLTRYGQAENSGYMRAVGRLTLVAAVHRIKHPGCKFDEMLILINPTQGTNKSTAIRTLAVNDDWFSDYLPLGEVGREVIEHIRGFWIIEASEMAGLATREIEKIKGFCSRQTDRGRMSYDKLVTEVLRSCIFIGTTNDMALFTDLSNRRFLPAVVGAFDVDALAADRDQLWAEAVAAEASGESIRLDPSLYLSAAQVQDSHRIEDAWTTTIDNTLGRMEGFILSSDVWTIVNKPTGQTLHADGRRMGKAMQDLGFERRQKRLAGSKPNWIYSRGPAGKIDDRIYVHRNHETGEITVGHSPSDPYRDAAGKRETTAKPNVDSNDVPF
jgi:virulence-associated protein E